MKNIKIYIKSILVPVTIGLIVGLVISKSIDYNLLIKPPFSPPSILFPIVWTILYILMGVSFGILETNLLVDDEIISIYFLQLFFNSIWPILFFVLKARLISFIWIVILVILVGIMIIKFYRKNKLASLLQIPYLLWSIFATYLNFFIYLLNR